MRVSRPWCTPAPAPPCTATPRELLQRLGVPVERSLPAETADGRIVPVDVGATTIRMEQLQFSTEVIFAKEG